MDKFIGAILMVMVAAICFYMIMNLDKFNGFAIPVPDKVVDIFKVKPFNSDFSSPTTSQQQY